MLNQNICYSTFLLAQIRSCNFTANTTLLLPEWHEADFFLHRLKLIEVNNEKISKIKIIRFSASTINFTATTSLSLKDFHQRQKKDLQQHI
ncbi:unnamed protein product [Rhizophagus irregularis]|nr:unnamed protein product [Rhizophagus irregularis]